MMSAKQYASKYPGKPVRLSAFAQKEFKLDDKPIGIVVGYRAGTLGKIGSSKVVIHSGKYPRTKLEFYTDRKYNAVVADAPSSKSGVYLLSVNYIEQLEEDKPVVTYPHVCSTCGQPARRGTNLVVCSNLLCKSKKALLTAIGPIPKFFTTDKEGYVLCPTCQIKDKIKCREHDFASKSGHREFICRKNGHKFSHNWKEGHKVFYQGMTHYIWKNGQLASYSPVVSKKKKLAAPF